TGEHGVEHYAHNCRRGQAGEAHVACNVNAAGLGVSYTDGQHEYESGNYDVAALGEVYSVFNYVAHADSAYHAVKHQRHAADGGRGHGVYQLCELRAEADHYGQHGSYTD